jgi:hypothetical protein
VGGPDTLFHSFHDPSAKTTPSTISRMVTEVIKCAYRIVAANGNSPWLNFFSVFGRGLNSSLVSGSLSSDS